LTPHGEQVVAPTVSGIWASVGHATRSVDECIHAKGGDHPHRPLESRFLWATKLFRS
jgi:hypothetical protein